MRFLHSFRRRRPDRRQTGQALAELAVVLPILLTMLTVILHFGIVIWTQVRMTAASREAVLYAAYNPTDDTKIRNVALKALPSWIDSTHLTLTITPPPASRTGGAALKVTMTYNLRDGGGILPGGRILDLTKELWACSISPVLWPRI